MVKRKTTKKRKTKRGSSGGEDTKARRRYAKGKRIEAYTFGEALGSRRWP